MYSPYNPNFYSKNDGDVFNYPIYIDSSIETMQSHEVLLPYFTKTRADGQRSFYRTQEIVQYRLKEEWYFDRERNVLERKIIGIAPVVNTFDVGGEKTGLSELFWLYFPACQKVFENYHCDQAEQNFKGTSLMTCFKDRLFNSYIIKESNLCPTKVDEYIKAINALLDYQMIRDKLSQLESELWLY